ncbi:MAG: T9SS type A sorting domain-containing protein [bacterium]|nr:T9SS type A sorting domain-containing protein [bacterium]
MYPLGELSFDVDSITVYMLDVINAPREDNPVTPNTCLTETCAFGLYKSNSLGKSGTWELVDVFNTTVKIKSSDVNSGEIYAWNDKTISISTDYGNNFSTLYSSGELTITGFDLINGELFFSTNTDIYKLEGNGPVSVYSIPTSSEVPEIDFPSKISLAQNYPNPFNPTTTIAFTIREPGQVTIELYSIHGQLIKELINEYKPEGHHSFKLYGSALASGVYILQGRFGAFTQSKTITLIK